MCKIDISIAFIELAQRLRIFPLLETKIYINNSSLNNLKFKMFLNFYVGGTANNERIKFLFFPNIPDTDYFRKVFFF